MKELSEKIISVTKKMRSTAYQCGSMQSESDSIPFGGSIRESIGPFPEFILKGRFCTRSLKGLCSPCFYSRLPVHNISEEQFDNGYLSQVKYILDNFQEVVVKNQVGHVAYNGLATKPLYGMVCTPTGSYFDECEYPVTIRKKILKILVSAMYEHDCEIALHIESHAMDVIKYFKSPDEEELDLLHQLHARVLLGFESINDFSRNVLYSKCLSIDNFEKAVCLLKKNGIPVGAFVFAGLFSYTDEESIADTTQSLIYLKEKGVAPVLMFSNTQAYTIPDVLFENGKFKLLDPRTVAMIVKETIDIFGCDMDNDIDPWFIADPKGGPPDPSVHIFNAKTSTTCPTCADKIYNAIENLRITKNKDFFLEMLDEISECDCVSHYNTLMEFQKKISMGINVYSRADELVNYADAMYEYYVLKRNPWKVKAELLCYGLNISDEQKKSISVFNPFIDEKGFVNATHIIFKDVLINVCVAEEFCKKSPYSIREKEGRNEWILLKKNIPIGSFTFLDFPEWVYNRINGEMIGRIARPHSNKCISFWPSLNCSYIRNGKGCKYCGLNTLLEQDMIQLTPEYVAEMAHIALKYQHDYEINLSGGTCSSPNAAVDYLSCVCAEIVRKCGRTAISVECAPPENMSYLLKLKNSGATAVVMNIEVYDEELRKTICPGKGLISNQRYFDSLKEAVKIFKEGNVSSVLIVGIQPKHDIIAACEKLVEIGVIPTLIPFKPLDGTPMENSPLPDCAEYIEVSRKVAIMLKKRHLKIDRTSGCAACGACSLESNLEEIIL